MDLIILLIKNNTDRKLLADFLRLSNYCIEESLPDSIKIQQNISLILTEAPTPAEMEKLFLIKHQSTMNYIPIVILLTATANSTPWIDAGFNDVLRMPLIKNEFLFRLKILLKMREDTNSEYKFIFKYIKAGIYKMSLDKKITTANQAFIQLFGLQNFNEVNHKTLKELGIITSKIRDHMVDEINTTNPLLTYESTWQINNNSFYILENIELVKYKNISFYLCRVEDLTEHKKDKDALEKKEEQYRQLVDYSPYGILITNDYKIEFINPSFIKMVHANNAPQLLYQNFLDILHPEFLDITKHTIESVLEGNCLHDKIQVKLIAVDYAIIDVEISPCVIKFHGKSAIQLTVNDITESLNTQRIISHLKFHDSLTNLANRIQLESKVKDNIDKAEDNAKQVYILLIDLDNFKSINDNFGHSIGDKILIEVANRLSNFAGENEIVARIGSDEFILQLSSSSYEKFDINIIVQSIFSAINKAIIIDGKTFNLTACIGCSFFPTDSKLVSVLFKKADIAMSHAKKKGKNNFEFCTPELTNLFNEKMMLEKELRVAINEKKLFLHFQPKLCLLSKKICGVEALMRWTHPFLGVISPGQFIQIAEDTELIVPLTSLVIDQCCQQIKIWETQNIAMRVAINISAKNLEDPDFLTKLFNCVEKYNVNPKLIEIEITETCLMQETLDIQTLLTKLKTKGMTISIDDFGSGYSSLSYLRRFTIDNLKIDQSFIHDLFRNQNAESIIVGIIAIAHSLKLNVIAEGVETSEQLQRLQELGCNEIQGFYFAKALSADELLNFLEKHENTQS